MARSRYWESAALLLVTFLLLRPGFFLDMVQPPFDQIEPQRILEVTERAPDNADIRLHIAGPSFEDPDRRLERVLAFDLGAAGSDGTTRFEAATGLTIRVEGGRVVVDEPFDMNSLAGRALSDMDFYADEPVALVASEASAERMPKEVFYIPALILFGLIVWSQRRRGGTLAGNPHAA